MPPCGAGFRSIHPAAGEADWGILVRLEWRRRGVCAEAFQACRDFARQHLRPVSLLSACPPTWRRPPLRRRFAGGRLKCPARGGGVADVRRSEDGGPDDRDQHAHAHLPRAAVRESLACARGAGCRRTDSRVPFRRASASDRSAGLARVVPPAHTWHPTTRRLDQDAALLPCRQLLAPRFEEQLQRHRWLVYYVQLA
eukprot:scaffold571_cov364-Prasinococcus_capsulatus_cf.AAC.8